MPRSGIPGSGPAHRSVVGRLSRGRGRSSVVVVEARSSWSRARSSVGVGRGRRGGRSRRVVVAGERDRGDDDHEHDEQRQKAEEPARGPLALALFLRLFGSFGFGFAFGFGVRRRRLGADPGGRIDRLELRAHLVARVGPGQSDLAGKLIQQFAAPAHELVGRHLSEISNGGIRQPAAYGEVEHCPCDRVDRFQCVLEAVICHLLAGVLLG